MNFEKKHRPQNLNEIVYADAAVQQTLKEYASGKRTKHLLLYGPTGSGKSLSAKLILHELMGVIEQMGFADPFNAKEYAVKHDDFTTLLNTWNMQCMYGADQGCVVFDEIDQFTLPMQHRLRAFVDNHEMGMIIGTTNNLHLVDTPLKNRCKLVLVDYPKPEHWVPRVMQVMQAEGFAITEPMAKTLLQGLLCSSYCGQTLCCEQCGQHIDSKHRVQHSFSTRPAPLQRTINCAMSVQRTNQKLCDAQVACFYD